jgi:hypothetical protein
MIGSLTELSQRPGMPSEATLRKLIAIHADFPILRHGTHGRKYQIDIEAAEVFIRDLAKRRSIDAETRQAMIRQIGLQMVATRKGARDAE